MSNLSKLLTRLENIKQRRNAEYRVNGDSAKYRKLTRDYYAMLDKVGKATE